LEISVSTWSVCRRRMHVKEKQSTNLKLLMLQRKLRLASWQLLSHHVRNQGNGHCLIYKKSSFYQKTVLVMFWLQLLFQCLVVVQQKALHYFWSGMVLMKLLVIGHLHYSIRIVGKYAYLWMKCVQDCIYWIWKTWYYVVCKALWDLCCWKYQS